MFLTHGYCGIILIHGDQFLWIVQNFLVRGAVISWVTGFRHNIARQFTTSLNFCGDVNSWVRVTHEIHEHQSPTKNNYSTVCAIRSTECEMQEVKNQYCNAPAWFNSNIKIGYKCVFYRNSTNSVKTIADFSSDDGIFI